MTFTLAKMDVERLRPELACWAPVTLRSDTPDRHRTQSFGRAAPLPQFTGQKSHNNFALFADMVC
jgi:hypothetical protein